MELDDKIIQNAMDRFGITKEEAEKAIQRMIKDGLLQENTDPSVPLKFKVTNSGAKSVEKNLIKEYGEFKKVTDHKGISYKVPTIVIIREGIKEVDLNEFPLWSDEE